jgi:hypothetical protein
MLIPARALIVVELAGYQQARQDAVNIPANMLFLWRTHVLTGGSRRGNPASRDA